MQGFRFNCPVSKGSSDELRYMLGVYGMTTLALDVAAGVWAAWACQFVVTSSVGYPLLLRARMTCYFLLYFQIESAQVKSMQATAALSTKG